MWKYADGDTESCSVSVSSSPFAGSGEEPEVYAGEDTLGGNIGLQWWGRIGSWDEGERGDALR